MGGSRRRTKLPLTSGSPAGNGWLNEHGSRPDDDQQEDSRAEAVAKFGIITEQAKKMVDAYDKRQRATAAASVEQLLADVDNPHPVTANTRR